jgi:DNA-binding NarL/FixJ family response regulator
MNRILVAITDDKKAITDVLQQTLAFFPELELLFVAQNGAEAIEKLQGSERLPQVMLMDIEMPLMNGIQTTEKIKKIWPEVQILMLSVFTGEDKIFQAILAGASGYLLKDEAPQRLLQSIKDTAEGRLSMSPEIAAKALSLLRMGPRGEHHLKPEDFQISDRELEILELVADGKIYKEIADLLYLSPKTVRNHIHNIHQKLQVGSKTEAVQIALKHKWF